MDAIPLQNNKNKKERLRSWFGVYLDGSKMFAYRFRVILYNFIFIEKNAMAFCSKFAVFFSVLFGRQLCFLVMQARDCDS